MKDKKLIEKVVKEVSDYCRNHDCFECVFRPGYTVVECIAYFVLSRDDVVIVES